MVNSLTHRVALRFQSRTATEFPSEKALKKYLKEHPKADRSKHTVKDHGSGDSKEQSDPLDVPSEVKGFEDLSEKEVEELKKLTRGRDGSMLAELNIGRNPKYKGQYTAVIKKVNGKIAGWWGLQKTSKAININAFTAPEFRGKGVATRIGREVIKKIQEEHGKRFPIVALPQDKTGEELYRKLGFTHDNNRAGTWTYRPSALKVARRHFIRLALDMNAELPTLWYENEKGDKFDPDLTLDSPADQIPKGYKYQFSRFPRILTENMLKMVTEEDVEACGHTDIRQDLGLIEGLEGHICNLCGGSQTKKVGEPWPAKWRSGGSMDIGSMNSSWPASLVLAMTRPTPEEIQKASERGHTITPMDLERAILFAGTSCERCMNVLLWRHGCDDGYEEGSPEWIRSNTRCELCS